MEMVCQTKSCQALGVPHVKTPRHEPMRTSPFVSWSPRLSRRWVRAESEIGVWGWRWPKTEDEWAEDMKNTQKAIKHVLHLPMWPF